MELKAATTVTKPPEEVYGFWSSLDRFPSFMAHVDDIQMTGPRTSHWKVSAPFGREVEWDAETTEQVSGSLLSWRSKEGADVANSGEVRFVRAPDGTSTEVHVTLTYDAPAVVWGRRWPSTSVRTRPSISTTTSAGSSRSWRPARLCARTEPPGASVRGRSFRSTPRSPCPTTS
jgi:hypothetical protein